MAAQDMVALPAIVCSPCLGFVTRPPKGQNYWHHQKSHYRHQNEHSPHQLNGLKSGCIGGSFGFRMYRIGDTCACPGGGIIQIGRNYPFGVRVSILAILVVSSILVGSVSKLVVN